MPPFGPSSHTKLIDVAVFLEKSTAKLSGDSGTVRMMAPSPTSLTVDGPYALCAVTLAKISDPHSKAKGALLNVAIGTEQDFALAMSVLVPSQLTASSSQEPSCAWNSMEYAKTADP